MTSLTGLRKGGYIECVHKDTCIQSALHSSLSYLWFFMLKSLIFKMLAVQLQQNVSVDPQTGKAGVECCGMVFLHMSGIVYACVDMLSVSCLSSYATCFLDLRVNRFDSVKHFIVFTISYI